MNVIKINFKEKNKLNGGFKMEKLRIYNVNYENWFSVILCTGNENVENILCKRLGKKIETNNLTIIEVELYKIKISDLSVKDFIKLNKYINNNKENEIERVNTYEIKKHYPGSCSSFCRFFTGTEEEVKLEIKKLIIENDKYYNFYYEEI